jgi:hypothetical protein
MVIPITVGTTAPTKFLSLFSTLAITVLATIHYTTCYLLPVLVVRRCLEVTAISANRFLASWFILTSKKIIEELGHY